MIQIRWTFQERICGTLIALLLISSVSRGQVPTISVSQNEVEIGSNFTVICHVLINSDIIFYVNDTEKGSCPHPAFGGPCVPPDIQQNTTAQETSWTLMATIEYEGDWHCNRLGVDSSTIAVSMYKCPNSIITESGIHSSLSLNDTATVSITIKIGCIYPTNNPEILLRFMSSISSAVPYIAMNCFATLGACSTGSAYECNQIISRGMGITNGPFDSGTNYTLHVDSIVVPSVSTCGRLAVFEPHSLVFETKGWSDTEGNNCKEKLIYAPYFNVMALCVAATFFLVIWVDFKSIDIGGVDPNKVGVAVDILVDIIVLWCIEYAVDFQYFRSDSNCCVLRIALFCHGVAIVIDIVKYVVLYKYIGELRGFIFEHCLSCDPKTHPSIEDIMLLAHFNLPEGYTVDEWMTEENISIKDNPKYVSNLTGTLLIKSATEKDNGIYQGIFSSEDNEQRVNAVLHVTEQKSANLIVNPLIWRQVKTKKLKRISDLKEIRYKVSRNDFDKIQIRNVEESKVNIKSIRWEHNGKITPSNYRDDDGSVPPFIVTKKQPIDEYHCTVEFTNKKSHVYIFIVKFTDVRSGKIDDVIGVPTILSTKREEITPNLPPLRHMATAAQEIKTSDRLPIDENNLHLVTRPSDQSTGAEDNS